MNFIKQHKWLVGGGIALAVVAWYLLSASGSTSQGTVGAASADSVAAGNSLQLAQLAAQTQLGQANVAAGAQTEHDAAQLEIAKLMANLQGDAQTLAASIAGQQINATLQATTTHDTLQAQVTEAGINGQTQQAAINANASVQNTETLASTLIAQINAAAATNAAAIAAATKCHGLGCWF